MSYIDHSSALGNLNSCYNKFSSEKVNMPKTVQTQTIEQGLFAVHKTPHFTSYIRVSYMRATFNVMNIRPNNILYQMLFVYCVSQTNVPQLCKETRPLLKRWHTRSVESESVARVSDQSPSCDAISHFERNSVLISSINSACPSF